MKQVRRAVIDVGTNSVKLLVADVTGNVVYPLHEISRQTRLGHGSYATRILQPEAINQTVQAVSEFAAQARQWAPKQIQIVATSAARDAANASELVDAIHRQTNLKLAVISGEQEAHWAYAGICSDPRLAGHALLIMDAGGGSTQLIYGPKPGIVARHSYRIGAVRLLEKYPLSDPPKSADLAKCLDWARKYILEHTPPQLKPHWAGNAPATPRFVGTGGSSSLLAAMQLQLEEFDRDKIESIELTARQVRHRMQQLWDLPLETRRQIPGLPANKADVILMGTVIHAAVMEIFSLPAMVISTRGFRFGALMADAA